MRLVLWANGNRGVRCLERLVDEGFAPTLVVVHASEEVYEKHERGCEKGFSHQRQGGCEKGFSHQRGKGFSHQRGKGFSHQRETWYESVARTAARLEIPTIAPADPNGRETVERLKEESPELFILAGYGPILRRGVLDVPSRMAINLHAGKLPEYRGSSPMNWALLNGETAFSLSIIRVDEGVDTGDVLLERSFAIAEDDTIVDLHGVANEAFPSMVSEVLDQIRGDRLAPRPQDPARARYFPLRFPEDGLVLWDRLTARQIHNRIRALRPPYPGAFTFYHGRKVLLISSRLGDLDHRGEPGRVYRKTPKGLLVCAGDRCLWITDAVLTDDETPLLKAVSRYETLATMQGAALQFLRESTLVC